MSSKALGEDEHVSSECVQGGMTRLRTGVTLGQHACSSMLSVWLDVESIFDSVVGWSDRARATDGGCFNVLQDMQSLMDNMMKQLLSKDVLYEPMKEIGRRVS
jgi:hypothetical protein